MCSTSGERYTDFDFLIHPEEAEAFHGNKYSLN